MTILSCFIWLIFAIPMKTEAQQTNHFPAELQQLIDSVVEKVIEWRRDIHQHPELGNREFKTVALVAEHLESLGIEVQTDVADTGVVGVLRGANPGPVVALRADMDALPVTERVDIPFASTVRTIFNGGEVRSNIIPEEVEMMGTMRALHPDDRLKMIDYMHEIIENTGRAMGVTATLTLPVTTSYPVTYNDIDLTNRMVPVLQSVAGTDNVILSNPVMGAEDFSFFAEQVPGFFIALGGRPSDVPTSETAAHHTPDFYIDDSRLNLGVEAFIAMILDYMSNP